ncbi:MAG: hypothetical protein KatS3mg109_0326 [Pirellulaceae bacterium]|nr:MAG: hypothetical protein KatS3mg109_0326 [Pirellulaceae bacterium]
MPTADGEGSRDWGRWERSLTSERTWHFPDE